MSQFIGASVGANCRKCGRPAVVRIPFAKMSLCPDHFVDYMEERIYKTMERYGLINRARKVLIALSGGKDSLSLAHVMVSLKNKLGIEEIYGVHVDLGLGEYSALSKEAVEETCSKLGLKCVTISLVELIGHSLPDLAKASRRPPCSVCGMVKRYLINIVALELGVDAAILGHHMDDILVFNLKNLLVGDPAYSLKMTPYTEGIKGMAVARLRPLYETYESDLNAYAKLKKIRYVDVPCPYKYVDPFKAAIRRMLDELESEAPGFKISLSRRMLEWKLGLPEDTGEVVPCRYCGMPSSSGVCSFCRLTERAVRSPLGNIVRERLREILRIGTRGE